MGVFEEVDFNNKGSFQELNRLDFKKIHCIFQKT